MVSAMPSRNASRTRLLNSNSGKLLSDNNSVPLTFLDGTAKIVVVFVIVDRVVVVVDVVEVDVDVVEVTLEVVEVLVVVVVVVVSAGRTAIP